MKNIFVVLLETRNGDVKLAALTTEEKARQAAQAAWQRIKGNADEGDYISILRLKLDDAEALR